MSKARKCRSSTISTKAKSRPSGRNSAVGLLFGVHAKGFIAWLMWLLIHIYFLVGFENRAFVMFNWIYSYLSYNRSARLILDAVHPGAPGVKPDAKTA